MSAPTHHTPLPDGPESGSRARRWVDGTLGDERGYAEHAEDIRLVVTELVTNAWEHGDPPIELETAVDVGTVRVSVSDRCVEGPEVRAFDARSIRGRGMLLVAALSDAWGTS